MSSQYRWAILAVFVLSTVINYLDRNLFAALAPEVQREFALNDTQYGWMQTAFLIPYAVIAPFAGLLIDRIGLTRAISLALALWSCAGIATGLTHGLATLIACRVLLGAAEAAGIPAAGKAIATFVKPEERALGHAVNQAAVSLGTMTAPLLAIAILSHWAGGRPSSRQACSALVDSALAHGRPRDDQLHPPTAAFAPFRDRRLWAIVAANALHAIPYSLWFSWTTKYFVTVFQMSTVTANRYAWIPPGFALVGGFLCGWASLRVARRGAGGDRRPLSRVRRGGRGRTRDGAGAARSIAGVGSGRDLARHRCGRGLQREPVCDAARSLRGVARGVRCIDPGRKPRCGDGLDCARDRVDARALRLRSRHHRRGDRTAGGLRDLAAREDGTVKRWLWRLLGKGPEVAVVTFCTGDAGLCRRMSEEVRTLVPGHAHFVVTEENWPKVRRELKPYRIGLVPVMLGPEHRALRRAAYRLAPHKVLAYNSRLERHHVRPDLASLLFWRGVPLDRIYLRPWWWPWPKRERSVVPQGYRVIEGARVYGGAAARGGALAVPAVPALARGRSAHLQPAARDGARIRRGAVRVPRWRRADRRPHRLLRAHRGGGEAAVSRTAMVESAAARGSRVPVARDAQGSRGGEARVRVRPVAGGVHAAR